MIEMYECVIIHGRKIRGYEKVVFNIMRPVDIIDQVARSYLHTTYYESDAV